MFHAFGNRPSPQSAPREERRWPDDNPRAVIVILIVLAIVIFAIATYALGASGLAPQRARAVAIAFAVVFIAGAAAHRLLEHRPEAVATAPAGNVTTTASEAKVSAPRVAKLDVRSLPLTGPKTAGSVDIVEVTKAKTLHVRGWAVTVTGVPGPALVAIVDHTKRIDISKLYGLARPDVATALKNESARNSGFDGSVPIAGLAAGQHVIEIGVASEDAASLQFPPNATHTFLLR